MHVCCSLYGAAAAAAAAAAQWGVASRTVTHDMRQIAICLLTDHSPFISLLLTLISHSMIRVSALYSTTVGMDID